MSKSVLRVLLAGLVAFVVYPLSYAPLHRLLSGSDSQLAKTLWIGSGQAVVFAVPDEAPTWAVAFLPVRLLIAHTPLKKPLLLWGGFWGVAGQQRCMDEE